MTEQFLITAAAAQLTRGCRLLHQLLLLPLSSSLLFVAACGGGVSEVEVAARGKLNVLLLSVDDLKPELGCYGADYMHTPHMDSIAAGGVRFTSAYCQQAICGPSRASMLTGCRPDTTGVLSLNGDFRDALPQHVTLPQLFKQSGWTTYALGKIHHGRGGLDDGPSWSLPCWRPEVWQRDYASPELRALAERRALEERDNQYYVPRVALAEAADAPDGVYPDALIADEAIRFLREEGDEPFFLAVGFLKPHLPFIAPRRYWDLYPAEDIELPEETQAPAGAPRWASHVSPELRSYEDVQDREPFSEAQQREFVRGYRACVSFVDAQIGRVLAALEEQGLAENTIVVVWGDHGWHLGDLGMFGKHTNYEQATRAPLIVSAPGYAAIGQESAALVEFVDLYPSLAEVCDLELPAGLEGTSFANLLDEPGLGWKTGAYSQYPRNVPGVGEALGRSLRTERYRVVEWTMPGAGGSALELYDYAEGDVERSNLASDPERRELLEELLAQLHAGWRSSLPPDPGGFNLPSGE